MDMALAIVPVFVMEEVKAAIKDGVDALWNWTVNVSRKFVEIPEYVMSDPKVHAPNQ